MAIYPCDHHGSRYTGAQSTIYPAIVDGSDAERRKCRLCPACFKEAYDFIGTNLAGAAEPEEPQGCCLCKADEAALVVFVTVYQPKQEREDFYGRLCKGDCLTTARVALFGAGAGASTVLTTKAA